MTHQHHEFGEWGMHAASLALLLWVFVVWPVLSTIGARLVARVRRSK